MSLQTDIIFIQALQQSQAIANIVGDRIYDTAIPLPDEDAENVPVPYIIVTYDGMQNDQGTKDNLYEGSEDRVQIGIECVAETRPQLALLTQTVRDTVKAQFIANIEAMDAGSQDDDLRLTPLDYQLSASAVQYDGDKPCYWQVLNYACATTNE